MDEQKEGQRAVLNTVVPDMVLMVTIIVFFYNFLLVCAYYRKLMQKHENSYHCYHFDTLIRENQGVKDSPLNTFLFPCLLISSYHSGCCSTKALNFFVLQQV